MYPGPESWGRVLASFDFRPHVRGNQDRSRPMRRRTVLLAAVLVLAVLAAAVVPWTLSGGGMAASVAKSLREGYRIDLEVKGRSTLALLPIPRIKFEDVR